MADIATLGLEVRSQGVDRANRSLDKLSGSARKAETSARGIGTGATLAARRAAAANDQMVRGNKRLASSFTNVASSIAVMHGPLGGVASRVSAIGETIRRIGPAALGMVGAVAAAFSVRPIFEFKDALAEVSTLVNTATFDMRKLEKAALDQAKQFGGGAAAQAKAFYQIISAGASTAAEATEMLTAANKLAIGGVTDIKTAADGLTSVMNAYGDRVESATAVSDAMFVAMRAGKTTIGELSGALGRVAPLAANAGVSFDELVASVAALTKGGIDTNESMTGVRAILAAVVKPTSEAAKLAAQLGIEFNAAGLKAKGFQGFLEDLAAKTGGNTEQLALLFGGVEALVPIMALSGAAGADFADIMDQMGVKASATQEAFDKMANSPGFQAGRIWSALKAEILGVGGAMGDVLVPAMRLLADNMENIFRLAKIVGAGLLVAFGPAILGAIVSITTAIGVGLVGAFNLLTAAMLRNPFGALAVAITVVITAIWQFRDAFQQATGVDVVNIAKTAANTIANTFTAGYDVVTTLWKTFPDIMAAAAIGAANAAIAGIESMLNRATVLLNDFISNVNAALAQVPGVDVQIGAVGAVSLGRIQNDAADRVQQETSALSGRVAEIMNRDLFGDFGSQVETSTPAVTDFAAAINEANDNLDNLSGGAGGGLGGAAGVAKDAINEVALAARDAGQAALDFAKDLTKGFVNDIRSGLEQGKGLWRSFADAAINAMNKIGDKLVDLGIDMMFSGLTGSAAAGGTGAAAGGGGIFGAIGKLFGFRDGGHPGGRIRGPGTSTSDSILTMLSNGPARVSDTEYIVNARSTRKFLPLLDAVNDNDASRIIENIPGFFAGGHPGLAGNGPGSGIAGSATGQGPGPGGTSAGATGVGGSAAGLGGHPGLAGGAAGQHGGSGGRAGSGGSAGISGGGGHPGISGNAAGDHGGGRGVNGAVGGSGGRGMGHPGMVGNAAGDRGFASAGTANQANKGDFGGPASVSPGFFGAIAEGMRSFPADVVAAMTAAPSKMQDRLVSSINKMQDRLVAPTRATDEPMAALLSYAMSRISNTPNIKDQSRIAQETSSVGSKTDLSAIFGDRQSDLAKSLNEAMTAIATTAPPSNPFGFSLSFPPTATGKLNASNPDLASAIAAMSGDPVPSNPFGGFPSAVTARTSQPAVPARAQDTPASPFAGHDDAIDSIVGGLLKAEAWGRGQNAMLGFQGRRAGAVGGGREWEELGGGRFSEGGFAGFFARGGSIPAGQWGIAGEDGPEPVAGPATVFPNSAMGSGDAPVINLRSGDIIIQGNADEETLPMIRREIAASEARMQKDLANNLGQYQGRWSTFRGQ